MQRDDHFCRKMEVQDALTPPDTGRAFFAVIAARARLMLSTLRVESLGIDHAALDQVPHDLVWVLLAGIFVFTLS